MYNPMQSIDLQALYYLADYRVLSVKQLAVLENANMRSVRRRLDTLEQQGFITKIVRIRKGFQGRPEHIFQLSPPGIKFLKSEEVLNPSILNKHFLWKSKISLDHQLSINWVLISANLLERFSQLEVDCYSSFSLLSPCLEKMGIFSGENASNQNHEMNSQFVPDAVFAITHPEVKKTLLFFLEVDRATEPLYSHNSNRKTLWKKFILYRDFLFNETYKKYEEKFQAQLNGFRLLLVCDSPNRLMSLCRLVNEVNPSDFIWLTTEESILTHGLGSPIWIRGGNQSIPQESILGPTYAFESPILADRV